jgi:uncharacterized protein (TIGR02646 family)
MIRILKPSDIPSKLATNGLAQNRINCRAYEMNKNLFIYKGKKPKKDKHPKKTMPCKENIYGCRETVKPILLKAQNYKCCYCERFFLAANLHVEHYRPKTRVRQAKHEEVLYPGYYWLMYDWDNLFLGCHECNSTHKGDLFPLENQLSRARSHRGKITREKPLLIKPSDDARLHIKFNLYGQPEPLSLMGARTIEDLGLLRDSLVKARLRKLIELLYIRSEIEDSPPQTTQNARRKLAHAKRRLKEAVSPLAEFSAMAGDVLNKNFDTIEHLLNLEKILKSLSK